MSKPAVKVPEPDLSSLGALAGDWPAYFKENGRLWREARLKLEMPAGEHPEPLVPARIATEAEVPSSARTVRALAEKHSWMTRCTYALGWVLGSRGDVQALTHTLGLRAVRDGMRFVAVWNVKEPHEGLLKLHMRQVAVLPAPTSGWKFDFAYGWGGGAPQHKLSAAALKTTIKGEQS